MQAKLPALGFDVEERFFGQPVLGAELAGCAMRQRLLNAYGKLHGSS